MRDAAAERVLDRERLAAWYRRNRRRTAGILALVAADAYYEKPIPLRHPFAFYDGHMPAFSLLTLNRRALREGPVDERLERLFERGIDPGSLDDAARHERRDWPTAAQTAAFGRACDARVLAALASARIDDASVPRLAGAQAVYTLLEHEQMHHETLLYIVHQLAYDRKRFVATQARETQRPPLEYVAVAAGIATIGADRAAVPFGWDNEFARHEAYVPAFAISRYPVTNGDYLDFVRNGAPPPPFWLERGGQWRLRAAFEELPLPLSWPVYASHDQAEAYARWRGARLPTEAEYHRAAYGTRAGVERPFPWGDDAPQPRHGNFNFARFDPEPVDAHPAGASDWGVHDTVGNGWEWTATPFAPFAGFEAMASYPPYSSDFFDGRHFVLKGASPVTGRDLIRRSFRNWFYADYPYAYAKFRCVAA
ncbi:MAG: SUMF1/EgtB/PvdO family nonheme iron enzyme [Vulcanimicrobiaceae bacterium]